MPAFGLYFYAYETSKRSLMDKYQWNLPLSSLASGALAGMLAWGLFHPIDVVKSIRQGQAATSRWAEGPTSAWEIAKERYYTQGWRFFVRGITPSVLRAAPVNAVTFAVYEQVMPIIK